MPRERDAPLVVLKFGGSVLDRTERVAGAVHECYRWVRDGHRVVAVVSAVGDATDRLTADADRYGPEASPHARAALVALGEQSSVAHLWLGLDRAGIPALGLAPEALGLRVEGPPLDAHPIGLDPGALREALRRVPVVVVPGFVGVDRLGRLALLGRGGSDCSAIVVAAALGARCRLLKDVPGLFERDPSRPGPFARRYASVSFADARRLDGTILQPKALAHAAERTFPFEVAGLGRDEATLVGAERTAFAAAPASTRLRTALLGFGVVGRGVWRHLVANPDRFEPVGIAVRHPKRHADTVAPALLRRSAADLACDPSIDLVIECLGGLEPAGSFVATALTRGAEVVTANKSLLAERGGELDALASRHGGRLRGSAAVGGAAPFLETTLRIARASPIASIEGIVNGTCNVILDRIAEGISFGEALAEAQALGYAESDPSADLDGRDAAEKVVLLARAAFGRDPGRPLVEGIHGALPSRDGRRPRLVARATRDEGRVALESLAPDHPLADVRGGWNRLVITTHDGERTVVDGLGAGRWPTAEAIIADAFDAWRERVKRERSDEPLPALAGIGGAA